MKKQGKRCVALCVVLCMMLSVFGGVSVFAANPTNSASETFDNFALNTNYTGSNTGIQNVTFRTQAENIQAGLFRFENVKGFSGKGADDGALKITYNPNITIESGKGETGAQATVEFSNPPTAANNGEFYEISFDYAYEGDGEFEVKAKNNQYKILGINNGKFCNMFMNRNGSWQTATMSGPYPAGLKPGTWYRIRALMQKQETTMNVRVYVDDTLAYAGQTDHAMKDFGGGFNILQGANSSIGVGKTTPATGLPTAYVDNFKVCTYTTDPMAEIEQRMEYNFDNLAESTDKNAIATDISSNTGNFGSASAGNLTGDTDASAKIAGGVMGKAKDDRSIYLNKAGKTYSDRSHMVKLDTYGMSPNLANQNGPALNQGEYASIEVYMAYDGRDACTMLHGFYKGMNEDGKAAAPTIFINVDGTVSAVNDTKAENVKLQPGCWYKFNLVMHSGDNTAESDTDKNWFVLYINDEKVIDKTVFVPTGRSYTINTFSGFQGFWLASQSYYTSDAAPDRAQSGSYFDDFSMTYTKNEPTFTAPKLTYSGEYAPMAMNGGLFGYVGSMMQGATLTADDAAVTIVDQAGAEKQAFTGNTDYIRVIKADGSKLFGMATNERVVDKEMHDFTGNLDMTVGAKAFTTIQADSSETGLAGKKKGDTYFTFTTTNAYYEEGKDELNPYVVMGVGGSGNQLQKLDASTTYTVEATLRATGNYQAVNLQFRSTKPEGQSSHTDQNLITIFGDGRIANRAGQAVGTYRQGEWVKVAATVYPKSNVVWVYANGNLIYQGPMWNTGWEKATLARIKIEHAFPKNDETNKSSGILNVDDVVVYNGVYAPQTIALNSSSAEIYNNGCVMFTDGISYADLIGDGLTGISSTNTPVLYKDATLSETVNGFQEGAVLAVPNDAGDMVKYYYVSVGAPTALKVSKVTAADGTAAAYTAGAHDYKVQLAAFSPIDATKVSVILAEKSGSSFIGAAMNESEMIAEFRGITDSYAYPVFLESGVLNAEIKEASSSLKLYTWDDQLTPLDDPFTIR